MTQIVLAEVTASVSELKKNPMGTVAAGKAQRLPFSIVISRLFIAFQPKLTKPCSKGLKTWN